MESTRERMTFDLRQRYRMAAKLIETIRKKKPLRILDGGSREGFLRSYLPEDKVVNLDLQVFPGDSFVAADLLRLPFGAETFDIVVSLDVLEHIEVDRRSDFLEEMSLVSRKYIIIGAPFHEDKVVEAEKLANDFYLGATGRENVFLSEHLRLGLPELDEIEKWAARRNFVFVTLPNNFLPFWQVMMGLSAYFSSLPRPGDLIAAVADLYDRLLADYDLNFPSYRKILLISKTGDLDEQAIRRRFAGKKLTEDSHKAAWHFADRVLHALAAYQEGTLLEFHEENNRLREGMRGVEAELETERTKHRETRAELETERAKHRETRAELETERAKHRETRAELDGIRKTLSYRFYTKTLGRIRNRLK